MSITVGIAPNTGTVEQGGLVWLASGSLALTVKNTGVSGVGIVVAVVWIAENGQPQSDAYPAACLRAEIPQP